MKSLALAGVVLAGLLAGGAAWADTECDAPMAEWQSRGALRMQLEQQGWLVQRIKIDDGCYEVRGVDADGNRFKAKYEPDSLRVRKMEIKRDRHGESRRERSKESR